MNIINFLGRGGGREGGKVIAFQLTSIFWRKRLGMKDEYHTTFFREGWG